MNIGRIVKKGCILLFVIIPLALSLVISGCGNVNRGERVGFVNGNISAGGLMCPSDKDDGWVYYRSEDDSWALYKARIDGSEKTLLCRDVPESINVIDGWVYYSNYLDGFSLYRIRTDGTEHQKLIDGYCYNLYVTENAMYFDKRDENNSAQIFTSELDGSNPQLIVRDMAIKSYYDKKVYCSNGRKLCSYNTQDETMEVIFEGYVAYVSADETGVYFLEGDENIFYRIDTQGDITALKEGGDSFTYGDGKLYYVSYIGEKRDCEAIFCIDIASGKSEIVLSLSNQLYDIHGKEQGMTLGDLNDGTVVPDSSMLNKDGELVDCYVEGCGNAYIIGDKVFTRGCLRAGIEETGKMDCLILCDGAGGIVWD